MRFPCFALVLALLLTACSQEQGAAAVAAKHAWIHPPTVVDSKSVNLPPFLVYRVHPEMIKDAVAELEKEPYIQLSPSMASNFTKTEVHVPAEMRPFLIRGLVGGETEITVVQSMQGLWVKAQGSDPGHPAQQPLVVLIDPTPIDIFVTLDAKP